MPKTVFDHVSHICTEQRLDYFDTLEDGDKKSFTPYMVHRILSMTVDYVLLVNEVQKYYGELSARSVYLVYSQTLPSRKVYSKYIKAEKSESYEAWLIELVAQTHTVSHAEATQYLHILYRTESGRAELRALCESWAVDPKLIKKVKL